MSVDATVERSLNTPSLPNQAPEQPSGTAAGSQGTGPKGSAAPRRRVRARERVVIIGAGFGGLSAAKALANAPVDVTLVDRRNYHLFQPLLYQVATAGLAPSDIAYPIRSILSRQRNVTVLMSRVTDIDRDTHEVVTDEHRIPYDVLIVATGARHAYFGRNEWEAVAPGLKKIDDATDMRRRILSAFERAETTDDDDERRRLLTFIVIGGGPTGVELAGAIAELASKALTRDFRRIDSSQAHVMLVEGGPRILAAFPEQLSAVAKRDLEKLGVQVSVDQRVTGIDQDGIFVGDQRIEARTVLWAAGVQASPASKWLKVDGDRAGRVPVGPELSLTDDPDIFVIGDTASAVDEHGKTLPGIAPVAKQQGEYLARLIAARCGKGRHPGPFRYRHYGNLATIGRRSAVCDFGRIKLTGNIAWWLWGIAHIWFLIGFRNRVVVALSWMWAYLSFHRGSRLITGSEP